MEARQERGLSQEELAQIINSTKSAISRYESGKRQPRIEQLKSIASALDVDVNWLMNGQTLEQRDQAWKDQVKERFADAETWKARKNETVFHEGEIFYGGSLKVQKVTQNPDDTFTVSFSVTEKGISADALKELLNFMTKNGISTEGLLELVEAAAKIAPNQLQPSPSTDIVPPEGKDTPAAQDAPEGAEEAE